MQRTVSDPASPAAERILWIDAAKGLAIIGVVLLHAQHWAGASGATSSFWGWVIARLVVPLPVFFLVSGLLAARGVTTPEATWRSTRARVLPLLWVFAIWQPAVFLYRLVGAAVLEGEVDLAGELVRSALAVVRPNGELWYLWALAIHLLLAHLTRRVPASVLLAASAAVFVVWGGLGATMLGADHWRVLGPGLQGLPQFALFTLVGARLGPEIVRVVARTRPTTVMVIVVAWLVLGEIVSRSDGTQERLLGVVHIAAGVASTILLARLLTDVAPVRTLRALGRNSLAPYVGHTLVIVLLIASVTVTGGAAVLSWSPILTVAGLVALGILVPSLAARASRGHVLAALFAPPAAVTALTLRGAA